MIGVVVQRVTSPVFVGREAEVDALLAALARAESGGATTVLVGGEAGIGKTRLMAELERLARERGAIVLEGACIGLGSDDVLPFAPIAAALRALVRILDPDALAHVVDASTGELGRLVPELGGTPDDASLMLPRPDWARTRFFEGLLTLLGRLSRLAPVVLVIEDLHWADRSTRDVLAFLARNAHAERLLVAATYRTDELSRRHPLRPWLAEMDRLADVVRIELARLDRADVERLLEAILGRAPAPELSAAIARRSGGNPFFAEELLAVGAVGDADRLPDDVREVVLARFSSLSDETQDVLRIAAVSGPSVDHELLVEVAGDDEARVGAAIREALEARLIVVSGGADGTGRARRDDAGRYAFRHALVQEAVYDDVLPRDRRAHHAAYAEALARRPVPEGAEAAGHLASLAHHATAAHELPRALQAWLDAARASIRAAALAESAAAYERALDLWDAVPADDRPARIDDIGLLYEAAMAHIQIGDLGRACDVARIAVERFDPARDPLRAALLRERLGRALWLAADLPGAIVVLDEAVALLAGLPPSAEAARVIAGLGGILMLKGKYSTSADASERAIAMASQVGATDVEAYALNSLSVAKSELGDCDRAIELGRRSLEMTLVIDRAHDLHRTYSNFSSVLQTCGRSAESAEVALEGVEWARRLGMWRLQGVFLEANGASALVDIGRWREARELLAGDGQREYAGVGRLNHAVVAGPLALRQGRLDDGRRLLGSVRETIAGLGDAQFSGPLYTGLIELARQERRFDEARGLVDEAMERMADTEDVRLRAEVLAAGVGVEADRAIEERARRNPDGEQEAIHHARSRLALIRLLLPTGRRGEAFVAVLTRGFEAFAEAELSRASGRNDPERWRGALERWQAIGYPYQVAIARYRLAESILAARGSRAVARNELAIARSVAIGLEAEPLLDAIVQLGRFARLDLESAALAETEGVAPAAATVPRVAAAPPPFGLTGRELEVLTQLVSGRSNRQIGAALFISESTVGVHVSNILGKLGVTSRVEAAAIAARSGIGAPTTSEPAPV